MQMEQIRKINSVEELTEVLHSGDEFKLYGAGHYLTVFLNGIAELEKSNQENYLDKISCIMVSDIKANLQKIGGVSVLDYREAGIKPGDYVLLTLGHRFTHEVYELLKGTKAVLIQIDFNLFQQIPYQEVLKSLQPFIDKYPNSCLNLNVPESAAKTTAWTCWWQGEKTAPDIVKACFQSQRRNLPEGVEHIIITKENYRDYIVLPEYVIAKVKTGNISLATLSDMIRAALLYKYGGFWLDSTLYVLRRLDLYILEYPIYTRSIPETQFCTSTVWAGWFMYAKPGNKLFRFLEESFFYYFSVYDKLKYYLMIDYIIAIACNIFPEIEEQMRAVPINNEKALELCKHLAETFDENQYKRYIEGASVQKLTYKTSEVNSKGLKNTIYDFLIAKGEAGC